MLRRHFLKGGTAFALMPVAARAQSSNGGSVTRSEAEWRDLLTKAEYRVMRDQGTERAFSSPLNAVTSNGMFHCKGCDQAVYSSETKFKSGTGWPSFTRAVDGSVDTKPDPGLFITRTEVHCDRCKSHLGHIFDDGPEPTGKRHCINGIAMVFKPEDGSELIVG